jgi:hypothetical protein
MSDAANYAYIKQVTNLLIDEGRIIEAGWKTYEILAVPAGAPEIQRVESRRAFFAGAQHLFGSMLVSIDPDGEATAADEHRMAQIDAELTDFLDELEATSKRRPAR